MTDDVEQARMTELEKRAADIERDIAELRRLLEAVFSHAFDVANPDTAG